MAKQPTNIKRRLDDAAQAAQAAVAHRLIADHPGLFLAADQIRPLVEATRQAMLQNIREGDTAQRVIERVYAVSNERELFDHGEHVTEAERTILRASDTDPALLFTAGELRAFVGIVIEEAARLVADPAVLDALRRDLDAALQAHGIERVAP